jgi:hypothetical protein
LGAKPVNWADLRIQKGGSFVRHLTERFIVRIGRADLDEARATGAGLGMNLSRFVRTALKERAALEAAIRKNDQREDDQR